MAKMCLICKSSDNLYPSYETKEGEKFCTSCIDSLLRTNVLSFCPCCSKVINVSKTRKIGTSNYCDPCYNKLMEVSRCCVCEICKKECVSNEIIVVRENKEKIKVCTSCYEKSIKKCYRCETPVLKAENFHGKPCCINCKKRYIVNCHKCNKIIDINDSVCVFYFNQYYCKDCSSEITKCNKCNKFHHKKDILLYDMSNGSKNKMCAFCASRFIKCFGCKKLITGQHSKSISENEVFCDHCSKTLLKTCIHCNEYRKKEEKDEGYCAGCVNKLMIQASYEKPTPEFYVLPEEKTDLFIGVELEIMGDSKKDRDNFMLEIFNNPPFFYFKEDCSIDNERGMEIVSHPGSYRYHTESGVWKRLFALIEKHKMNDTEDCGLHFHVSRLGFKSNNAISLLDFFVNKNSEALSVIGGREFNDYCEVVNKNINNWGNNYESNHCDCVNLSNRKTVEIRFCASTYLYEEFMERLNLIYNLVCFVNKNHEKNICDFRSYNAFKKFANSNGFSISYNKIRSLI